ncbi:MAG: ABC transporter permease [Chloroflexi bacterium]|nr:ABC transporter permease [Chloroflexota bacterium]
MRAVPLLLRQVRYENRSFWRNPPAAFFTIVFPLMFLVIFNLVFSDRTVEVPGGEAGISTFYVPGIIALSVIGACYTNVAMGLSFSRDQGLLKRVRATPLPTWALLGGKIAHAVVIGILLVAVVSAAGTALYDVAFPTRTLPAFALTLVIGSATFSALGLAVTSAIPNADAAPAIVNASILPLLFISDVFIPLDDAPAWLTAFSDLFPVRHFSLALQASFNPFEQGTGFEAQRLAVMAAWMVVSILIAIRFFRWESRR